MVKLRGISWDHPRGYDPLHAFSKRLVSTNLTIKWDKRSLKDFGDKSLQELARTYDLLVIDHPHIGSVHQQRTLVNLNDYLSADEQELFNAESVGHSMESYWYKGSQWAIPIDASCQTAAYRPDLLNADQLPDSWKGLIDFAAVLKEKELFIGTALCPTDCNCIFLTIAAQHKFSVAHAREKFIRVEDGVAVLETIKMIAELSHPESLLWNPVDLYNKMTSADEIAYCPAAFAYINYSRPELKNRLRFAAIPGGPGALLGGAGLGVSAFSENIPESVDVLRQLCDPLYQQHNYRRDGGQPAMLSAWKNEMTDEESGNFFSEVYPVIKNAYMRPRYPFWPKFQEWLGDIIHEYLTKKTEPEKLIRQINQEYNTRSRI